MGGIYLCGMIEVVLTDDEKALAWDEAHRRQAVNEESKRRGRNGAAAFGMQALMYHLYGAAGEIAVASYLDMKDFLFQDKTPVRGSCDLPNGIDVKCRSNHKYDLLVQIDDDPSKKFVLVTIQSKRVLIQGWIQGKDAMQEKWIKEYRKGRPAYAVPQSALLHIDLLK